MTFETANSVATSDQLIIPNNTALWERTLKLFELQDEDYLIEYYEKNGGTWHLSPPKKKISERIGAPQRRPAVTGSKPKTDNSAPTPTRSHKKCALPFGVEHDDGGYWQHMSETEPDEYNRIRKSY